MLFTYLELRFTSGKHCDSNRDVCAFAQNEAERKHKFTKTCFFVKFSEPTCFINRAINSLFFVNEILRDFTLLIVSHVRLLDYFIIILY